MSEDNSVRDSRLKDSRLKARAVYFTGPGRVDVREEDLEGDTGVLVRSRLIAISHGTESLFYKGPFPSGQEGEQLNTSAGNDYPIKYGYMNLGQLEDDRRVFAFYPHQDVFLANPDDLMQVPDHIRDEDAVLYPSVETAFQIVHDAAPLLAERAIVFGLGMIGQLVCRLLIMAGCDVIGVDPAESRRLRATATGVRALDPGELSVISDADLAINTSAHAAALQAAIDVLAPEARVIEASWYGARPVTISLGAAFHRKRLHIRSSQVSHLGPSQRPRWNRVRRNQAVWKLMDSVRPGDLVSHRIPLNEAARAYELIAAEEADLMQILLVP